MKRIDLELSPEQAQQLLEQVAPSVRTQVLQRWEQEARRARWEPLVQRMRRRFARHPFSWRELRRVCEEVRQENYEREQRARRR